jgi:predicted nicotinamide N-methyase
MISPEKYNPDFVMSWFLPALHIGPMLYHIRFFKVPSLKLVKGYYELSAVITIANDLGESTFMGDVELVVCYGDGISSTNLQWKSGMKSVNVLSRIPTNKTDNLVVSIVANMTSVNDVLQENPWFLSVKTLPFCTGKHCEKYSARYDFLPDQTFQILEETGSHNLARHVWDAGLATCKYLHDQASSNLKNIIATPLTILELGTGCGLVGLTLSSMYSKSTVLLTDLEDAREICQKNIDGVGSRNASFETLDWDDIRRPQDSVWNLVVVTDCTYNPSSYGSLLHALDVVLTPGKSKLILAHKYRDPSEEEFFERLPFSRDIDITLDYYHQPVRLLVCSA